MSLRATSQKKIPKKLLLAAWACKNKNYGSGQISERILREIFEEVIVYDPQEEMYHWGQKEMNERLLKLIAKEKPDVAFFWLIYDEFYIDTLVKIREISPNTRLVNFFGDDDSLFENYSRFYATFFDHCLIFQRNFLQKYKNESIKNVHVIMGVDTEKYRPLKTVKKYDVSFIGTPKQDRHALIKFLIANKVDVRVFGSGWEQYPDMRGVYGGKLSNEEIVRVINESKINLSFTKNYEGKLHFKGRVVEIASCKSFSLGEYFGGYHDLYLRDKEVTMFRDKEDLLRKIRYYLLNEKEREEIATRAYKRTLREFSLEKEMRRIFRNILGKRSEKEQAPALLSSKKVVYLTERDLLSHDENLCERVRNFDYVGFQEKNAELLSHKEYFQVHSLESTNREVSCCDYFVVAPGLGDLLACQMKYARNILQREDFLKICIPSQMLVRKNYFVDNLRAFRQFFLTGKPELLECDSMAFVSIPFVKTSRMNCLSYEKMEKAFLPKFEDSFRALSYQKRFFTSPYLYRFIIASLFGRIFLLRRAIQRFALVFERKIKKSTARTPLIL